MCEDNMIVLTRPCKNFRVQGIQLTYCTPVSCIQPMIRSAQRGGKFMSMRILMNWKEALPLPRTAMLHKLEQP
jgi:hypothetical protein